MSILNRSFVLVIHRCFNLCMLKIYKKKRCNKGRPKYDEITQIKAKGQIHKDTNIHLHFPALLHAANS